MADLMLPEGIKLMGGRAACIQKLESVEAELKSQGIGVTKYTVAEPSPLIKAGGLLYAVVPYDLELIGPGGGQVQNALMPFGGIGR